MNVEIREMSRGDWPEVRAIYRQGIATGLATLETEAPAWETWDENHLSHCRLGKLRGAWKDVMLLERRSERVGVD